MSLLNVPAGKDLPEDIYVVIEIPANADPIFVACSTFAFYGS